MHMCHRVKGPTGCICVALLQYSVESGHIKSSLGGTIKALETNEQNFANITTSGQAASKYLPLSRRTSTQAHRGVCVRATLPRFINTECNPYTVAKSPLPSLHTPAIAYLHTKYAEISEYAHIWQGQRKGNGPMSRASTAHHKGHGITSMKSSTINTGMLGV